MPDANEQFEADAARFYAETHILAPGKSEPRDSSPDMFTRLQLRGQLWNLWSLKEEQLTECRAKALRDAATRLSQRYSAAVRAVYDGGHVTVTFHDATEELRRMAAEAEKVTP